jgi:hypothetical protein
VIDRNKLVVGLLALLAAVSAIGFGLMFSQIGRDACFDGGVIGGSCPTLAEVNGVRYTVSVARGVAVAESDVTPYNRIARTNVPDYFKELQTYSLRGISPMAALVAPSKSVLDEDDSEFRLLFGPDSASAFPALCDFYTDSEKQSDSRCSAAID